MLRFSIAAGLSLASLATGAMAATNNTDPLSRFNDTSRVLAVVAPDASDPRYREQRRLFTAMKSGARERDLVWVEGLGASAPAKALRARFGIGAAEFRALLIGKDGGEKLVSETPLGSERLFPLIDSMPMRQREMRRAGD